MNANTPSPAPKPTVRYIQCTESDDNWRRFALYLAPAGWHLTKQPSAPSQTARFTLSAPNPTPRSHGALDAREMDILVRIASGNTNDQIATAIRISPDTVRGHLRTIYRKLYANSRAQAVNNAHLAGYLPPTT